MVGTTIAERQSRSARIWKAILAAGYTDFARVVKTTVFLKDMNEFAAMNEVYANISVKLHRRAAPCKWPACRKMHSVEIEVIALIS